MGVAVKKLRIGRRRDIPDVPLSPFEIATAPALVDGRWKVPDRFNITRDLVEGLADKSKRQALTFLGTDGVIEPRTFVQVAEGAARWAVLLRESGIEPGDRVLVVVDRCVDWLDVVLGVLKAGAIAALCPATSSAVLEHRLAASGASFIVADRTSEAAIGELSSPPQVHYVDEGRRRRGADAPKNEPTHDTASRDIAFLVWTPGTESQKPVALTHGSIFAARVQAEHWLDAGRGDSVWCTSPISSSHMAWHILAGAWARDASVVLYQGEFDPVERLDLIDRLGPTILCQAPTEYRALAELRQLDRYQPPRVRRLVSTGDYLDAETIAAFEVAWGMTIHDGYGQVETNIVVGNGPEGQVRPGSMGLALPGHHVAVIDAQGNELPASIEGDLAVRGRPPTLFAGYWESPEETKDAFRGDWYLTGDVASTDELGFLWFVGRADDVITSRGRTFGPDEVERVLRGHEAVESCAVVGVRDLERGGQFVRAFVVLAPEVEGTEPLEAELRQFVGESLPEQQVPREVEFVEELPAMPSGNLRRRELRERPVARRPLWNLPPTSERELEPPILRAPEPPPEHGLRVVAAPEFTPEPAAAPESPAPTPTPEREPELEPPLYFVQPAPEIEIVAEAAPEPEPEPEPEPVSPPEPEPRFVIAPDPGPEPEPTVPQEPKPELVIAPEPQLVVAPETELVVAPEQEPEPQPEPQPEPEPEPEPEPALVIAPDPVPDVMVEPVQASEPAAEAAPVSEPEASQDPDQLPDYIVDPTRGRDPEREPPPQFLDVGLPPVTNFPTPGERSESERASGEERPRARPPRRTIETSTAIEPSIGEPGDEADEMGWMKGLSSRLTAYNLGENDTPSRPEPDKDDSEDAKTGS
jgi:acyl-coenzyme A synthetase/AMP-(fatty) acid ligase